MPLHGMAIYEVCYHFCKYYFTCKLQIIHCLNFITNVCAFFLKSTSQVMAIYVLLQCLCILHYKCWTRLKVYDYDKYPSLLYKGCNNQKSFIRLWLSKAGDILKSWWILLLCLQMMDLDESV
jgi:hypothetical protein